MANKVLIACKLPHGLRLDDPRFPNHPEKRVIIKGLRHAESRLYVPEKIRKGMDLFDFENFAVTEVDADFWKVWSEAQEKHGRPCIPYKNGMFWETKSKKDAEAQANDVGKTGFEGIDPANIKKLTGIDVTSVALEG